MNISKAVITAAAPGQRTLQMQTLIDRDGHERTVLQILLREVRSAGIDQICLVIPPGDESGFLGAADDSTVHFLHREPRGYADALYAARSFTGGDAFLHLVGDHLHVGADPVSAAKRLINIAAREGCSVSAVQATRETLLPLYGTIGGHRISGDEDLYRIEEVIEKPTPTEAEQRLLVSGLRAGQYLCFFGMHVFTPAFMEILGRHLSECGKQSSVSGALAELANRERYLALGQVSRRYDVGVKYGLFKAQLALALSGQDRNMVLAQLLELVAMHNTEAREVGPEA